MKFPCKKNADFNAVSVNAEMTNNTTSQCPHNALKPCYNVLDTRFGRFRFPVILIRDITKRTTC